MLPCQADMRPVYAQTRALLVPSIGHESGGRVAPEALLNGIPIVASASGGVPEILGGGGFLIEVPESVRQNRETVAPAEAVAPWLDVVSRLEREPAFYQAACERALRAAARHDMATSVDGLLAALAPFLSGAVARLEPQRAAAPRRTTNGPSPPAPGG